MPTIKNNNNNGTPKRADNVLAIILAKINNAPTRYRIFRVIHLFLSTIFINGNKLNRCDNIMVQVIQSVILLLLNCMF